MANLPEPITRIEQYLYAIASQNEEIEKQSLLTQYVAAMAGVYIPEEDSENVSDTITSQKVL